MTVRQKPLLGPGRYPDNPGDTPGCDVAPEGGSARGHRQYRRASLATGPYYTLNSSVTPNASVAGTSTLVPIRSTPRIPPASSAVSAASSDTVRNVSAAM